MESVDHGRRRSLVGYDIIESAIEAGYPETKNLLKANGAFNRNRYDPSLRNGGSNYIQNEVHEERQREILNFSHYALGENIEEASSLEEPYVSLFDHIHDFIYFEVFTKWIYDESNPEFTEQQQIVWSIIIGIVMGIFTAFWSDVVELSVEFVWKYIPETLYEWGVFTDLNGSRPLPHYMWLCPAFFGGVLSFITAHLPKIPGQNEWIESLHRKGLMDYKTCIEIFLISTAGMASGLSLGPELPLVMTSGMIGSFFAKKTHQSVLSTRVLNLTAASAAIGGFFGFPMAGALFVLELPHKMGLQYYEALNPSVLASITSVLTNRIVTRNDVKGYFNYPFLKDVLPSHIFYIAILYGLIGALFGVLYVKASVKVKKVTHDLFHDHGQHNEASHKEELEVLSNSVVEKKQFNSLHIKNEPIRATIVGVLAGVLVGIISMFYPINLFWGEAQLQTLIDNGQTPLPIFGRGEEINADLTAFGYCMTTGEENFEFSVQCSAIFVITKILVIGLSLGTGIIGGHFWGPLYVGAAGANLFNGLMDKFECQFHFGYGLSSYPCLAVICIMGSAHVATFKTHMAIILILTLTITSFNPSKTGEDNAGDYAAVFPLLVVSCFFALLATRSTSYYNTQRDRGDIKVSDQTLCEPGKFGEPIIDTIDDTDHKTQDFLDIPDHIIESNQSNYIPERKEKIRTVETSITQDDIERKFALMTYTSDTHNSHYKGNINHTASEIHIRSLSVDMQNKKKRSDLLYPPTTPNPRHKRVHSDDIRSFTNQNRDRIRSRADSAGSLGFVKRISSFGEIEEKDMQPPLLEQARLRAASKDSNGSSRRKVPRSHRRIKSNGSDYSSII